MKLNQFLKKRRRAIGITQAEFAKKLGLSSGQFVSNWERNVSDPPPEYFKKISTILRCQLSRLVFLRVYDFSTDLEKRVKG